MGIYGVWLRNMCILLALHWETMSLRLITAVDVQTMEDDSMNELSLGVLEGHKSAVNPVKIWNTQMISHCCCVSCAAANIAKGLQTVAGDWEISRDLNPAKLKNSMQVNKHTFLLKTSIYLLKTSQKLQRDYKMFARAH